MAFGFFKKNKLHYPIFTSSMIKPEDAKLSATDAKKAYRAYMKQTGYSDNETTSQKVTILSEDMSIEVQILKDEIENCKGFVDVVKDELYDLNDALKEAKGDDKTSIEKEVKRVAERLQSQTDKLNAAKNALKEFKEDKRSYIINYVNTEVHGENWRELLGE